MGNAILLGQSGGVGVNADKVDGLDIPSIVGKEGASLVVNADETNLEWKLNDALTHNYTVATGTNAYAVTIGIPNLVYAAGMMINFKAATANTASPVTLNVNGLGAKTIKKNVSTNLEVAEIKAGQIVSVLYDGTNFQVISGSGGGSLDGSKLVLGSVAVGALATAIQTKLGYLNQGVLTTSSPTFVNVTTTSVTGAVYN